MGILTQGYRATDSCCTVCCMGGFFVVSMAVLVPLEIVCSPVLIPIRIMRNKKFARVFQQFLEKLSEEDKKMFMNEICKTNNGVVKHADIVKYHEQLKKPKYNYNTQNRDDNNEIGTKKADKLPAYYKKNIVWSSMPNEETMLNDWEVFFTELKRQKSMTESELLEESMKDLYARIMLLGKNKK